MKDVTYNEGGTAYKGVLAYDDAMKEKRPGMIVVHEWWGITQHVRDYPGAAHAFTNPEATAKGQQLRCSGSSRRSSTSAE